MRKFVAACLADSPNFLMMFDQAPGAPPVELAGKGQTFVELGGPLHFVGNDGFGGRYRIGNQAIRLPRGALINPTDVITVEVVCSVPMNGAGTSAAWADFRPISCTQGGGWNFQHNAGSGFGAILRKTSSGTYVYAQYDHTLFPPIGTQMHIAFVYDGAHVIFYLNGLEVARGGDDTVSPISYAASDVFIACEAGVGEAPDYGGALNNSILGSVAIYPSALSPARIAAHAALAQKNKRLAGTATLDNGDAASKVIVRDPNTLITVGVATPDPVTGAWELITYDEEFDIIALGPPGYRPVCNYPIQSVT